MEHTKTEQDGYEDSFQENWLGGEMQLCSFCYIYYGFIAGSILNYCDLQGVHICIQDGVSRS